MQGVVRLHGLHIALRIVLRGRKGGNGSRGQPFLRCETEPWSGGVC